MPAAGGGMKLPFRVPALSPLHWVLRVLGVLAAAYFLVLPLFQDRRPNEYGELADICILALAALSLNLLIGFTGQISIGHSAFFGVGAYTTAILMADHGWSPGWTFVAAGVICFGVGVLVGLPALRLKGLYLTLVTLALAQMFPALIRKFEDLTGGSRGIGGLRYEQPSWSGLDPGRAGRSEWLFMVSLAMLAIGYVIVRNLVKSRTGRAMIAVRDNATAAAVMGINVAVTKTVVFGLSAALCGVAGSMFALRQTQANPETQMFTILGSIVFLVIMVIGGAASLMGPIVGAFVYYRFETFTRELPDKTYLPGSVSDFLEGRPNLATIVFAALLIVLMFVAPFGMVGLAKRIGRKLVVVIPRPPSGHAAPPVADVPPPPDPFTTPEQADTALT
jgi:branched-chain amino acid transport system permease protein